MTVITIKGYWERKEAREEWVVQQAIDRASEWMSDPAIIQNHFESGDMKITRQLAELMVASRGMPRGPHRNEMLAAIGSLLVDETEFSFQQEAEKQIHAEEEMG